LETIIELTGEQMAPEKKKPKMAPRRVGDVTKVNQRGNTRTTAAGRKTRAVVSQAETAAQLRKWRKDMEQWIDSRPNLLPAAKTDLKDNVAKVADEVSKGKQADSGRLERLLNVILSLAPDIFDVAIATLANPLAGLGLAAKKIGERARVEWQMSK
jgi:hypothetical protein